METKHAPTLKPDFSHRIDDLTVVDSVSLAALRAKSLLVALGMEIGNGKTVVSCLSTENVAATLLSVQMEIEDIASIINAWYINKTPTAKDKATTTP